jgi:hypothetical protein
MTQFDDREKAEERRQATKEELEFKSQARRNKLLGAWAANLMGLDGDKAESYASSLVVEDLKQAGDEDVFAKVSADLKAANVEVTEHQIRREMETFLQQARTELGA